MRWESKVPLGRYLPTYVYHTADKNNQKLFCVLPFQNTNNNFPCSYQLSQVSLFQVSSAAQGYQVGIDLFPLSRILRTLSQSIRTILHSTRQTLQSISYCFGTSGIYSTFYISIDFIFSKSFYIFLGGVIEDKLTIDRLTETLSDTSDSSSGSFDDSAGEISEGGG